MKISVSLPIEDVDFLDRLVRTRGYGSRSAVLHHAVRLLRSTELAGDYEDAWREWSVAGEEQVWALATGDGLPG